MKPCTTPDCARPRHARGLCNPCYRRLKRAGELPPSEYVRNAGETCSHPGCGHGARFKLLCKAHYEQVRRWGETRDLGLRLGAAPKPRTPKPSKTVMPPGWNRRTVKPEGRDDPLGRDPIALHFGPVSADLAIVAELAPKMRALLARHDALDLADMLGVS